MHVGAVAQCPHGIPMNIVPGSPRVLVSGMPVATLADQTLVAGCPFIVSGVPKPCVQVQWLAPATRVMVNGQPVWDKDKTTGKMPGAIIRKAPGT